MNKNPFLPFLINIHPTPTKTHKSLGPQEQLNIAYTITAPASTLPAPGQFFVESAAFCPSTTTDGGGKQQEAGAGAGEGAEDAVSGVLAPIVPTGGAANGGQRQRRRALRVSDKAAAEAADAQPAAAVESKKAVDDNFLQNPLDQRWYVQAQTRLNNTDAKRGRCNVQFKVRGFWVSGHTYMCRRKPNAILLSPPPLCIPPDQQNPKPNCNVAKNRCNSTGPRPPGTCAWRRATWSTLR